MRTRVTVTGLVDPSTTSRPPRAGMRYVAVKLRLRSTGIAHLEDDLTSALLSYGEGRRARPVKGVKADCSNGIDGVVVVEVSRRTRGCLLFQMPVGERPRQFQLAFEQVPAEAGGRWRLR
jgi:hypothetical protein